MWDLAKPWGDQRGFTLAELLVSAAIIGLIMAGLMGLWMSGNTSYLTGANQVEAQESARVAVERMVREIRGAGYNPTNAIPPFSAIVGLGACPNNNNPTATAFMIVSDGNGNGTIQNTECVLYVLNGTTLDRQDFSVDAAPQTTIGGVQGVQFTYWGENGAQLLPPTAANIRSMGIQITTVPQNQPGTWQAGLVSIVMNDQVRIRNR